MRTSEHTPLCTASATVLQSQLKERLPHFSEFDNDHFYLLTAALLRCFVTLQGSVQLTYKLKVRYKIRPNEMRKIIIRCVNCQLHK